MFFKSKMERAMENIREAPAEVIVPNARVAECQGVLDEINKSLAKIH